MRLLYSRSLCLQVPQAETCPIRWKFLPCGIWKTLLDKQTGSKEGPKHLKTPNQSYLHVELILFYTIYIYVNKYIYNIYIYIYTSCIHLALRPNSTSRKLLINLLSTLTQLGWLADFCVSSWSLLCGDKEWISRCANPQISLRGEKYNLIWQYDRLFCGLRCYFRWPFFPSVYLFFNQGRFAGGDLVFLVLERIMPGTRWCGKN